MTVDPIIEKQMLPGRGRVACSSRPNGALQLSREWATAGPVWTAHQ